MQVAASSIVLGSGSLGLNSGAPEVCKNLWFTEGSHAGGEGDFGAHSGSRVALLSLAFRLLKLLCERIAHHVFNGWLKQCSCAPLTVQKSRGVLPTGPVSVLYVMTQAYNTWWLDFVTLPFEASNSRVTQNNFSTLHWFCFHVGKVELLSETLSNWTCETHQYLCLLPDPSAQVAGRCNPPSVCTWLSVIADTQSSLPPGTWKHRMDWTPSDNSSAHTERFFFFNFGTKRWEGRIKQSYSSFLHLHHVNEVQ